MFGKYEEVYTRTAPGSVEVKTLPAVKYLSAHASGTYFKNGNRLFGRLFEYIRQNDVKMTVPVEADMERAGMRFFVGSDDRERELSDDGRVAVRDRPETLVLAVGVRGAYSRRNYEEALRKGRQWLDGSDEYETAGTPSMVYWNSPFVPAFLKKSELHIPIEKATETTKSEDATVTRRKLTAEEERVILHGGTERPFTGKYTDHDLPGTYVCRQCGATAIPLDRQVPLRLRLAKLRRRDRGCGDAETRPRRTTHGNPLQSLRRTPGSCLSRRELHRQEHPPLRELNFPRFHPRQGIDGNGHLRRRVFSGASSTFCGGRPVSSRPPWAIPGDTSRSRHMSKSAPDAPAMPRR